MPGSASFQSGWKSISGYFLFADHTGGIAHIRFQENHVPFVGDFNYA